MPKFTHILFDLDGTLTDPGEGITRGVAHALTKMGIEPPPLNELYKFIGPPLLDSFGEWYGMDEAQSRQAVKYYREYYSVTGLLENNAYPGIEQVLQKLRDDGYVLAVATSKPEMYSVQIIKHFGLDKYFEYIAGSDMEGLRVKKGDVIAYCLRALGSPEPERVLMVGDRLHDINGAHENAVKCAAVLWGYGSTEEFERAGAEYVIETPERLTEIL